MPRVAVVVAKYTEATDWVSTLPPHWDVFVYDKSTPQFENKGREAETMARFIFEQYDNLDSWDCAVFLQGHPFDHLAHGGCALPNDETVNVDAVVGLGAVHVSDGHGCPDHDGLPVARDHSLLFGVPVPVTWSFIAGAQFCVPVAKLRRRPKEFWHRLHDLLYKEVICAWTMERLWVNAFCDS